ncbi:MAG: hypothetical protein ABL934_00545 [Lysobacteraceae bacterium]
MTILVLFVSGAVTALRYRQLPGDQRIPWIDKNLNDIVQSIGAENALPFETALWSRVRRELASDLTDNQGAYFVQGLSQPISLPDGTDARREVIVQLCDALPEWSDRNYSPRVGFSVARGYQTFLGSLEPFPDGISTEKDRDQVAQLIGLIQKVAGQEEIDVMSPETELIVARARADLEVALRKHKVEAERKGYRTTGPAEYLAKVWNRGSTVSVTVGGKTVEKKNCIATAGGESIDLWLAGRSDSDSTKIASGIQSLDLTDSALLPENTSAPRSSDLTSRIQVRRLKVFRLERPDWFSSEALSLYGRKGRYRQGALGDPMKSLWGVSGVFNLLPVAIVVIDTPSAIIDLPSKEAEKLVDWAVRLEGGGLNLENVKASNVNGSIKLSLIGQQVEVREFNHRELAHVVAIVSVKLPATYGAEPL